MAREVTVDDDRPRDRRHLRRQDAPMRDNHVRARIVVLAASACESARILLNSKSAKFPQGLANSSGVVGKYLTDSTGTGVTGFIPQDDGRHPAQRGRHRRRASLHAVVARQQEARFPARLSHRDRRRPADAGRRLHRRHPRYTGVEASGTPIAFGGYGKSLKTRLSAALRRDGELRRPRRDDPERGHLLRDRSARRRQVGHPGAALPLQVERLRDQAGRSTCRRPSARSSTRWAARRLSRDADARAQDYGLAPGGRIIHEVGVDADGQRPEDVGAEQATARRTTRRTCSSPTAARSCRRPTRTARGRSSRWRCARRSTSPTSANEEA